MWNESMTVFTNDLDLVLAVLATAEAEGYVLIDGKVYLRGVETEHQRTVERAAVADEEVAVRQLVGTGHLKLGAARAGYVVGKHLVAGRHVLTTPHGRRCRLRWSALVPLPRVPRESNDSRGEKSPPDPKGSRADANVTGLDGKPRVGAS
jgi:hypothetical protein